MRKVTVVAEATLQVKVDVEYDELLGTQEVVRVIQNHVNTELFQTGNIRHFEIRSVDPRQ